MRNSMRPLCDMIIVIIITITITIITFITIIIIIAITIIAIHRVRVHRDLRAGDADERSVTLLERVMLQHHVIV